MANKLLTIDMITNEALRLFVNSMVMGRLVNRKYSDYFAKNGMKIGKTLRIRKPVKYYASEGRVIQDGTIQSTVEEEVDLTVQSTYVALSFTTEDLKYSLDDFGRRILQPAVNALINRVDRAVLSLSRKAIHQVGDVTQGLNSAAKILEAGVKLDNAAAPRDGDRIFVVSPSASAAAVNSLKGLFNAQREISENYVKGLIGKNQLGFDFYMSQNVWTHTNGTGVADTVTINGANQTGTTLTISGLTGDLTSGDRFNIAGVFAVNPVSRENTNVLQDFVVTGVNNAKTAVTVLPSIITEGVDQTVSASPANGAELSFIGNTNDLYDENLFFHKDAIALAIIDRNEPKRPGAEVYTARSREYDCAITIAEQYNIVTEEVITKLMLDFAYEAVIPEWMGVFTSKTGPTE